ncbi:MAG: SLOG family protein [Clostridia bacterium]|nr:SLOG family protein [Clostridia bacterium]
MEHSVCFIGHRKINVTQKLKENVRAVILQFIKDGNINFIFGSHSEFNSLCYETVSKLKKVYPNINRINFRANYENADEYTMQFLTVGYEKSISPAGISKSGKCAYIKRNTAMIDQSDICVFYYDETYSPENRKSGTKIAYNYAISKNKKIININT